MNPRFTNRLAVSVLLLFGAQVFFALQPKAQASEGPTRFVCAARVDCGAPGLPSTQDLPTASSPIVVSQTVEAARTKCVSAHTSAYLRLAKSIDELTPIGALGTSHGCKVVAEALPAK